MRELSLLRRVAVHAQETCEGAEADWEIHAVLDSVLLHRQYLKHYRTELRL
jgi:hypothetical protein